MIIKHHLEYNSDTEIIDTELGVINAEQRAYDPIWLAEQVTKGNINQGSLSIIADMVEVLNSICPNLWDLQVHKIKYTARLTHENISSYGLKNFTVTKVFHRLAFKLIIKFPEIIIKNSRDQKHIIKDLYVRIKFHEPRLIERVNEQANNESGYHIEFSNLICSTYLYGLRGTLSSQEYRHGYLHSHLYSRHNYNLEWGKFCLGSGEINQTLLLLSHIDSYTTELFTLLLLQLEAYVVWESLSGVPYIFMSSITQSPFEPLSRLPSLRITNINDWLNIVKRYWANEKALDRKKPPNFDWKIENKNPVLILNEKVDTFLRIWGDGTYNHNSNYIFYQDSEGNYYSVNQNVPQPINRSSITTNTFVFQGRVESLRVEEETIISNISSEFVFHPKIKLILKQKLEAYAINTKIRSDLTQRAIQFANSRGTTQENTVLV